MKEMIVYILIVVFLIGLVFLPNIYQSIVGNKKFIDTNHSFNKAEIYVNNEKIEIEIDKWKDYEGEQLQIIGKDGKVYLVSSFNTILIGE